MTITEQNKEMRERVGELNKLLKNEDFKIIAKKTFKNNGSRVAYMLHAKGHSASPAVYFSNMDAIWESEEEIVAYLKKVFCENCAIEPNLEHLTDREYILRHVKPRLVSSNNINDVDDEKLIYRRFLDMLVLYMVEVKELSNDEGTATCALSKRMLADCNIDEAELFSHASQNMEDDCRCWKMDELLKEMRKYPENMEETKTDFPMWVVTNTKHFHGAAAILSEEILLELSEKFNGENFVILPSSVHECIVVPEVGNDPDQLRMMVREVNDSAVIPEERLTYNIYIYRNGRLEIY